MRRSAQVGTVFVVALALAVACQKDREHPPGIDSTCPPNEPNCHELPPPGSGSGGGSGGSTTDGGAGVSGQGTTLTGDVVALTSEDFESGVPYGDSATISADAVSGGSSETSYDGTTFTLEGVLPSAELWVTVTPAVVGAFLPTLEPLSSEQSLSDLTLFVVPASTIDLIYGLLSLPVAREVGRAHVVLRFLDAQTGDRIEGVTVSHVGETVAYDAGGSWSDVQLGTGSLGYAVLVNAPAQSNRTKQKVSFDTGTVSGSVDIAMQSDAVTLADIAIAP